MAGPHHEAVIQLLPDWQLPEDRQLPKTGKMPASSSVWTNYGDGPLKEGLTGASLLNVPFDAVAEAGKDFATT